MQVSSNEADAFARYLSANSAFWKQQRDPQSSAPDKIIYVDIYHSDPEYLRLNCLVGRYIQHRRGGKLVGLLQAGRPRKSIITEQSIENTTALARSFGIEDIITIETGQMHCPASHSFIETLKDLHGSDLKEAILRYVSPTGLPVGLYAYENHLRSYLVETITDYDDELEDSLREACMLEAKFKELFAELGCDVIVSGHLVYSFWAIMAHTGLLSGASVVYCHPLSPEQVFIFDTPPPFGRPAQVLCRQADTDAFHQVLWPNRHALTRSVEATIRGAEVGLKAPEWWIKPTPEGEVREVRRRAVRERLGWSESKPVIAVCAHTFSDAPMSDVSCYNDYFTWIEETLRIAARDPGRYYLFKRHPFDTLYCVTGASDRLYAPYGGYDHIRVVGSEITREDLLAVTDLGVTIRGSLGYDLPAHGIPCLLAGRAPYSDIGFCEVAGSPEQYEAMLVGTAGEERVSDDNRFRAQLYFCLNQLFGGLNSPHILGRDLRMPEEMYWTYLTRRVELFSVEQDPLYRNLFDSWERRAGRVLNFDLIDFLRGSDRTSRQPPCGQPFSPWPNAGGEPGP